MNKLVVDGIEYPLDYEGQHYQEEVGNLPLTPNREETVPLTPYLLLIPGIIIEAYGFADRQLSKALSVAKDIVSRLIDR